MKRSVLLIAVLGLMSSGFSQSNLYEPLEIQKAYENGTRERSGIPGREYWQNTISYDLKVELDPQTKMLKGTGKISYFNNSPDTLRYMVIKLLPNIHKEGSARDYAVGADQLNKGMLIDSIAINNHAEDIHDQRKFREFGTVLYVIFNHSDRIVPGSQTDLYISWNYEVITGGIRNGAYTDSAFFIGYFYPQIAVYDDVYGWDREDYTGKQETYNDLGTYKVEITVPDDYIVWATGDQLNEEEIFSDHTLGLINKSRLSEETIHITTGENYVTSDVFKKDHPKTWKFSAENVPDFAWACSNNYKWDANSLRMDHDMNRTVWINAVYPLNTHSFEKVADVARQGIEYLSNVFPGIPYPFDKHITFNGIHYIGVEYPMMANNGDHEGEEMYTELTIHEIAHNYIPFYMLSNERKHAWIDEGWVKLMGELHGESLGMKREDKQALNSIRVYERLAGTSNDLPLIIPSGFMTVGHNFYHSYAKASIANMYLLEILEEKGIENPLRSFLMAWQGKHPTPYDFFNYMNTLCGEELSWFWEAWYFNFNSPDLAITKSDQTNQVKVMNKGGIPLPIRLTVIYDDNREKIIEESIWSWSGNLRAISIEIPEMDQAKMIHMGAPDIPDIDSNNNTLVF